MQTPPWSTDLFRRPHIPDEQMLLFPELDVSLAGLQIMIDEERETSGGNAGSTEVFS